MAVGSGRVEKRLNIGDVEKKSISMEYKQRKTEDMQRKFHKNECGLKKERSLIKPQLYIIIIFLFSLILAFFIGTPRTNSNIISELDKHKYFTLYDINQLEPQGYEKTNNGYITLNSDPWFISGEVNQYIYNVSLEFDQPLPQNTVIDIFYRGEDEVFTASKKYRGIGNEGDQLVIIPVNQTVTYFRVDIGEKAGQIIPYFTVRFNQPQLRKEVLHLLKVFIILVVSLMLIYIAYPYLNDENLSKIPLSKYTIVLVTFFAFLVFCKVNDSNMLAYRSVFPNNVDSISPVVLGTARSIRSDEWGVNVSEELYRFYQPHMGITSIPEAVVFYVNPCNWGYLFLPYDMAFSWSRMLPYIVTFMTVFYFFRIFMETSILYPALGAFILTWAPESMWWNSITRYMQLFLVFDFVYLFFRTSKKWIKTLCCFILTFSVGSIVVTVYPAWHIPLAYFGLFLMIGTYLQNKEVHFEKYDLAYIFITIIAILSVVCCCFFTQKESIELIANTVYPGKRLSNGGKIPFDYFGHYLMAVLMPFKNVNFLNNSQASAFISLFPIPQIIYLIKKERLKEHKVLSCISIFIYVCAVYMLIGFPELISRITLFSYSLSQRVHTIFGMANVILLILEVYYISKENNSNVTSEKVLLILTLLLTFFYYIYMCQKNIVNYLGLPLYIILVLFVIAFGLIALFGEIKLLLIGLSIVTIISGVTVNPITIGTDIVRETPIAKEIRAINNQEPGNWIAVDGNIWKAKYLKAQGVECLNALNYPPRFDLFSPLDPQGDNVDIYNRYSHVSIELSNDDSSFNLVQADWFHLHLNVDDMKKWDIKYVLSSNQLELNDEFLYADLIYKDELDGNLIYKIHYK